VKINLKQVYWIKIPEDKIRNTIWAKEINEKDQTFDRQKLEQLFAASQVSSVSRTGTSRTPQKTNESIISVKRSTNIGICLAQFSKYDVPDLPKAIIRMDERLLTVNNIEQLLLCLPTPSETIALKEYQGDPSHLTKAEQFMLGVIQIPRIDSRLKVCSLLLNFPSSVSNISKEFDELNKACDKIQTSQKLEVLLFRFLVIGNFLNNEKGRARGFKPESLLRFSDTHSNDSKMTLLEFVVDWCEKDGKENLSLHEELSYADSASKISLVNLRTKCSDLSQSFSLVQKEIEELQTLKEPNPDSEDTFLDQIKDKSTDLEKEIGIQNSKLNEIELKFQKTCEYFGYFGDDLKKISSDEFFGIFSQFLQIVMRARVDIQTKTANPVTTTNLVTKLWDKFQAQPLASMRAKMKPIDDDDDDDDED